MCSINNVSTNGCSATPGSHEKDMGCPELVQQGECWPNTEPCGITESEMLASSQNLGVAFSQNAWAAAQQEGCLGCPDRYPKWPAKKTYARINTPTQIVVGEDPDFAVDETPFIQKYTRPKILKEAIKCTTNKFIPTWPDDNPNGYADFSMKIPNGEKRVDFAAPENRAAAPAQMTAPAPAQMTAQAPVPMAAPVQAPMAAPVQAPMAAQVQVPMAAQVQAPMAAPVQAPMAAPKKANAEGLMNSIGNGVRGIGYDLSNWSNIQTKDLNGKSKIHHVFLRDNRFVQIIYLLLISLILSLILYYIFKEPAVTKPPSLYYAPGPR